MARIIQVKIAAEEIEKSSRSPNDIILYCIPRGATVHKSYVDVFGDYILEYSVPFDGIHYDVKQVIQNKFKA